MKLLRVLLSIVILFGVAGCSADSKNTASEDTGYEFYDSDSITKFRVKYPDMYEYFVEQDENFKLILANEGVKIYSIDSQNWNYVMDYEDGITQATTYITSDILFIYTYNQKTNICKEVEAMSYDETNNDAIVRCLPRMLLNDWDLSDQTLGLIRAKLGKSGTLYARVGDTPFSVTNNKGDDYTSFTISIN